MDENEKEWQSIEKDCRTKRTGLKRTGLKRTKEHRVHWSSHWYISHPFSQSFLLEFPYSRLFRSTLFLALECLLLKNVIVLPPKTTFSSRIKGTLKTWGCRKYVRYSSWYSSWTKPWNVEGLKWSESQDKTSSHHLWYDFDIERQTPSVDHWWEVL